MDLRTEIDSLISSAAAEAAYQRLGELWRKEKGPAAAAFVNARAQRLQDQLPLITFRVAILRSFTVEPVVPLLRASAFVHGINLSVHLGGFNTYAQEILDEGSELYSFAPDAVILAVRTADLTPDLWQKFTALSSAEIAESVQNASANLEAWIRAFRERSSAALVVHNLEQPVHVASGVRDAQTENGQAEVIRQINDALKRASAQHRSVYVLDYDGLAARHGRLRWNDERKWLTARMPIAADQLVHLSDEWLRFLAPLCGKLAKALVVDLDNTLWGGVIGEDGMSGIQLGPEYPGAAYQAVQRAMLDLSRRGILLAVASKNNHDDAMEALEKHPGMLLRPEHFAAVRINWGDKADNLGEIAQELNIGLDALAFLDDNPVEREQVRNALPQVAVIDLPADPLEYAAALRDFPGFERLSLSAEDTQRSAMYITERKRSEAEHAFHSREDFYRYLEQEAEVAPLTSITLVRIAQLTQKTNQFNLTTHRYSEQQIAAMAAADAKVVSLRVRDRFGDHGLVGVAITRDDEDACEIDTFLLSCRVIGRTVETALLAHLSQLAATRGKIRLRGWFQPTKKNEPASRFYAQHGFELVENNGKGSLWGFDLRNRQISCPDWIKLTVATGERN